MSTQGVFLSRSMSRSFMYGCGSDRITKHPERCAKATPGERCSNYVRRTGEATPGERLRNSVRTTANNYSSSNEARRRRCRAASAEGELRPEDGYLQLVTNIRCRQYRPIRSRIDENVECFKCSFTSLVIGRNSVTWHSAESTNAAVTFSQALGYLPIWPVPNYTVWWRNSNPQSLNCKSNVLKLRHQAM